MLQVVKSTFIGKLVLKYIKKILRDSWGGSRIRASPRAGPDAAPPQTVLPPRNWSELSAENGAPLNADRHSVAAIRSTARPDDRVLAPAVRGTGLPVRNKRKPCQIEGSAAAITSILKRKAGSLTLARGWPLASHSLRQQKEGNRPIEREVVGTIKQVFALKCAGFLLKCSRISAQVS